MIAEDFDSDAINDEFTSEEKDLMFRILKKSFKKNFSKSKNNNLGRNDKGGNSFKG